jgi:hypothetical protein
LVSKYVLGLQKKTSYEEICIFSISINEVLIFKFGILPSTRYQNSAKLTYVCLRWRKDTVEFEYN